GRPAPRPAPPTALAGFPLPAARPRRPRGAPAAPAPPGARVAAQPRPGAAAPSGPRDVRHSWPGPRERRRHAAGDSLPLPCEIAQSPPPGAGDGVVDAAAAADGSAARVEQTPRFQRVQGRVEDVLAERDRLARDEADEPGELIAIHFPPGEQPQHQELGYPRHEGWSLRGHRCLPYLAARGMVLDPRRAQKFHTPVRRWRINGASSAGAGAVQPDGAHPRSRET